jgi:hypothetical protein
MQLMGSEISQRLQTKQQQQQQQQLVSRSRKETGEHDDVELLNITIMNKPASIEHEQRGCAKASRSMVDSHEPKMLKSKYTTSFADTSSLRLTQPQLRGIVARYNACHQAVQLVYTPAQNMIYPSIHTSHS